MLKKFQQHIPNYILKWSTVVVSSSSTWRLQVQHAGLWVRHRESLGEFPRCHLYWWMHLTQLSDTIRSSANLHKGEDVIISQHLQVQIKRGSWHSER